MRLLRKSSDSLVKIADLEHGEKLSFIKIYKMSYGMS